MLMCFRPKINSKKKLIVSIFLLNLNHIYMHAYICMRTYAKVISKRTNTQTIQYNTEFAGRADMGHFKMGVGVWCF